MMLRLALLTLLLALSATVGHAQPPEKDRPRDAAEAVQEGDVTQWIKYYERERGRQPAAQQQGGSVAPNEDRAASDSGAKR